MDIRKCECEGCDKTFIAGYGFSLGISWLATGHAYVTAFSCPHTNGTGQHWGCCPHHAMEAAIKCLREHMHVGELIERHDSSGHPRYAEGDTKWAIQRGEAFHIVSSVDDLNSILGGN